VTRPCPTARLDGLLGAGYALHLAGQHSGAPRNPGYRDFAFTIGMCYQVSDTTLRDPQIRRTVLVLVFFVLYQQIENYLIAVRECEAGGWRRADGEAPGWRGEIRTRSAAGRMANTSGGLRSTPSPSIPACTGPGALTSSCGALQACAGASGLSPGASTTTMPSWPPPSVGRVPRASGRSSA
jgi:hypothetical protein